jgi:hypothetical protein
MPDDLASRVITDASGARMQATGGAALVAGIQGDSGDATIQRLYLDPGLKSYVEFPADAAITNQELSTGIIDCTGFWLPQDTSVTWRYPVVTTANKVSAPQLAKANGSVFRAARAAARYGAAPGTGRFGVGEAIAIGGALWAGAGELGVQDDILDVGGDVLDEVGSFFGSLF